MPQDKKTRTALAHKLGVVLRQARTRVGVTQEEAAARVGVATEVYGRLERGVILPSLPTLVKLCRALSVDANMLLGFPSSQAPAWLTQPPHAEKQQPEVRGLVRAVRRLKPRQLNVLGAVVSVMLSSRGTRGPRDSRQATP